MTNIKVSAVLEPEEEEIERPEDSVQTAEVETKKEKSDEEI